MTMGVPPRLVTVWSPDWPVAAAGVPAGVVAAVVRANRVVACSPAAAVAGIRTGQRRRDAQRCCPEVQLLDHDPARDAREFERVVRAVADLVPRLDVVEPGWLMFAARGPSRYFGGDVAFAERLVDLVAGLTGWPVGVGVADGRVTSAIAARQSVRTPRPPGSTGSTGTTGTTGSPVVVAPGTSPDHLGPLPLSWAIELGDADAELIDLFTRLGVRTFADLAALPVGDVLARFGPAGAHVHRLAAGADLRPAVAVDPPVDRCIEQVFPEPAEAISAVVFSAKQLADELVAVLSREGRVCTRLVVLIETDHGERSERSWYRDGGLSAPAMVERVRWQLDGWVAGPGITAGIVLLRLVPAEVRGDDGVQIGLWGGRTQADDDAHRAITRLVGLAGADAVTVPVLCGGRLPAERVRWDPVTAVDLDDPRPRLDAGPGPWPGGVPAPSPAMVLQVPEPADVLDERGRSIRVGGRGDISAAPVALVVGDRSRQVVDWAGPWPLDQRWWEPGRHRRLARLQLVTDDGAAYSVCIEQQRWWVSAVYC